MKQWEVLVNTTWGDRDWTFNLLAIRKLCQPMCHNYNDILWKSAIMLTFNQSSSRHDRNQNCSEWCMLPLDDAAAAPFDTHSSEFANTRTHILGTLRFLADSMNGINCPKSLFQNINACFSKNIFGVYWNVTVTLKGLSTKSKLSVHASSCLKADMFLSCF